MSSLVSLIVSYMAHVCMFVCAHKNIWNNTQDPAGGRYNSGGWERRFYHLKHFCKFTSVLRAYVIFAIYETKTLTTDPADLSGASTTRFYPKPTVLPSHPAQPLCLRVASLFPLSSLPPNPSCHLRCQKSGGGAKERLEQVLAPLLCSLLLPTIFCAGL